MELTDRHIVVTGAASGIGRSSAIRFAERGARAVVVADLDAQRTEAVASEIASRGCRAKAIVCDVGRSQQIELLVRQAEEAFGPIDIFFANAGIGGGFGLETTDEEWDEAFRVNVLAHVVAARLLVPGWVQRGEGYFVSTASAAGLLTIIGSAPYAVTKSGAIAFAEWLSLTYGDAGVRVSCLCPMGVNTAMLQGTLELPGEVGAGSRVVVSAGKVLEPEDVADSVVAGIAKEEFLILPHPEVQSMVQGKVADRDSWLTAMRHIRARALESDQGHA